MHCDVEVNLGMYFLMLIPPLNLEIKYPSHSPPE